MFDHTTMSSANMYMAMGSVPATVQHLQPELATGLPSLQAVLGRVRRDLASPDCLVKNALKAAHNSRHFLTRQTCLHARVADGEISIAHVPDEENPAWSAEFR